MYLKFMIKSNSLKILLTVFLLALVILAIVFLFKDQQQNLTINGRTIKIEIADETEEVIQGLSGKTSLCADCGMLFIFPDYQIRTFWMKEMNFPLDIVWIKDEIIVGFEENIQPFDALGNIRTMTSAEPVNRVLELNAGWVSKNKVNIGDKLEGLD